MELSQLISFYHVARLGSVSKASDLVFRTQPAVSQQIKALEEEIGCSLFHRIGRRKLVPTEEGKRLQHFVRDMLGEMDRALKDIHAISGGARGRVVVSAPFTTCFHILPEVLKRFAERFPNVHVTVLDCPQEAALGLVRDGEADFAIALESAVPRGLRAIRWKKVVPVLMVPKGHPMAGRESLTIEEIAKLRLIVPPSHPGRSELERAARAAGLTLTVALESSNVELSAQLVEKGLGISFATVVESIPLLEGRELQFVPLGHILPMGYLAVATRDDAVTQGAGAMFLEALMATRAS